MGPGMSSEVLYMRKDGVICARLEGDSFRLNHPGTRGAPRRRRPALDEAVRKKYCTLICTI